MSHDFLPNAEFLLSRMPVFATALRIGMCKVSDFGKHPTADIDRMTGVR